MLRKTLLLLSPAIDPISYHGEIACLTGKSLKREMVQSAGMGAIGFPLWPQSSIQQDVRTHARTTQEAGLMHPTLSGSLVSNPAWQIGVAWTTFGSSRVL